MRTVVLAGAWLGALVALASGSAAAQVVAGAGAVALALATYPGRRGLFLAVAALGVIGLAWLRWESATGAPAPESVAWWADGSRRTLLGTIEARPELRGATQRFVVDVRTVFAGGEAVPASGKVQVRTSVSRPQRAGDLVQVTGALGAPPVLDDFDYRAYLARREIYAVMDYPRVRVSGQTAAAQPWRALTALRERAREALWDGMPASRAALAEGILLGRRSDIPRSVEEEFRRAGVSHLIVISGYNIALVGGAVMGATTWLLGRRRAALLALALIGAYAAFVGTSPPVLRATVMGAIAIVALLSGRPNGGAAALLVAAAALTAHDPRILQEVSFQLSVAATAGLVALSPPCLALGRRLLGEEVEPDGPTWRSLSVAVWDTAAVTLCATAATLPLLLVNFGRLSAVSPLANLALVPLFPAVLIAGAAGVVLALVLPGAAGLVLLPLSGLLDMSMAAARAFAAAPGAELRIGWFSPAWAAVAYGLLALIAFGRVGPTLLSRLGIEASTAEAATRHAPLPLSARPLPLVALAPAALLALIAATTWAQLERPSEETRLEALNLAGSPAALVTLRGGGRVLVDTGLAPGGARAALDERLGGRERLAAVVITRDLPSAVGGLEEVIRRHPPALLLVPPEASEAPWAEAARAAGVGVATLRPGLTVGRSGAHLRASPATERGRWQVAVQTGGRTLAWAGASGDAGMRREGRTAMLYAATKNGELRVVLRASEAASVSSDGERLRLHPPRGRLVQFVACPPICQNRPAWE